MQIKKGPYQLLLIAILFGLTINMVSAQTPYDAGFSEEAAQIREQVQLFTDRSIYAVNETIRFVANHTISGPVGETHWSSVLYVELLAPSGKSLAQGKYLLSGGRAEGTLHIPAAALTGDYHLKCYSRWMRNEGPGSFSYTPLKIINPYRSEVAVNTSEGGTSGTVRKVPYKEGVLECFTGSALYRGGQEAVIQVTGASLDHLNQLRCCITVVPAGAIDLSGGQYLNTFIEEGELPYSVSFLPDMGSGVSISGTVVGPDQLPVPYATLHFSLLGEIPDFFATISDENGRFVLNTSTTAGEKEFFVTPEQEEGAGLEVRIDQEYDARVVTFPGEPFELSVDEMEVARKIALNMQLSKAFSSGAISLERAEAEGYSEGKHIPFYGTRVNRLLIDDYVRLPNLEEIFINLIPDVQFYKKNGKKRMRIFSDNSAIGIYNPLIMIDHISVFDHEAVLALSPDKVERIDLINEIYLKGNVAFGGVLAIYSRNGDMAGIDLPKGSYFFDYQSFYPDVLTTDPLPVQDGRVPDTRNTIFWKGDLLLQKNTLMEIPFRAPATSGKYVVLVRGVSPSGEVFSASTQFSVE